MPAVADSSPDKYEARWTQAADYLRGSIKWTLLAFGAIGTTLLAGSQLSNLGKFSAGEPRLWLALAFALAALLAAAYAMHSALRFLYTGHTEFYRLASDEIADIEKNKALLEGFISVKALRTAYEECISVRHSKIMAAKMNARELKSAETLYHYLDGVIDKVVSHVRNYRMRQEVKRTRKELTRASMAAAVALLGFAWAANPAIEKPAIVLQAPASEARVALTETGRQKLAPVIGANCVATGPIGVIVLSITTEGSEVISLKTKDCPIKRFTLNDSLGKLSVAPP